MRKTKDQGREAESHKPNSTTADVARELSRGECGETESWSPKPDVQLSNEDDQDRPFVRTEDGEREAGPPKPNPTTTNVTVGQANTHAIHKMEVLISARDLTGHVTKSSKFPLASGAFGHVYRGYLNPGGKS